ncbi:MAG TPA: hypothetical protein VGZ00_10090 [Candidatus Baltobacteraceae bacterium]|jgi:hypothetical protein|nr:hypothetical protein [Candidatus Baltobacteraceae bacterium]
MEDRNENFGEKAFGRLSSEGKRAYLNAAPTVRDHAVYGQGILCAEIEIYQHYLKKYEKDVIATTHALVSTALDVDARLAGSPKEVVDERHARIAATLGLGIDINARIDDEMGGVFTVPTHVLQARDHRVIEMELSNAKHAREQALGKTFGSLDELVADYNLEKPFEKDSTISFLSRLDFKKRNRSREELAEVIIAELLGRDVIARNDEISGTVTPGDLFGEKDVETSYCIFESTLGNGQKKVAQVKELLDPFSNPSRKPIIIFGPGINKEIECDIERSGNVWVTAMKLVHVVRTQKEMERVRDLSRCAYSYAISTILGPLVRDVPPSIRGMIVREQINSRSKNELGRVKGDASILLAQNPKATIVSREVADKIAPPKKMREPSFEDLLALGMPEKVADTIISSRALIRSLPKRGRVSSSERPIREFSVS